MPSPAKSNEEELLGNTQEDDPIDLILSSGGDNDQVRPHKCVKYFPEVWNVDETTFCCEDSTVHALNEYQTRHYCSLTLERTGGRPDLENNSCPHGLQTTKIPDYQYLINYNTHICH